jgi:hypothetical protein
LLYKNAAFLYKAGPFLYKAGPFLYKAGPFLYKAGSFLYKAGPLLYKAKSFLYKAGPFLYKNSGVFLPPCARAGESGAGVGEFTPASGARAPAAMREIALFAKYGSAMVRNGTKA